MSQSSDGGERDPEDVIDVELMRKTALGDLDAFEELVERHQHRVFGTAVRMLNSQEDAEDIAQQVFVRVWKSAKRYKPTAKFSTWLMTITRNLVLNEVRRRTRKPIWFLEEQDENASGRVPDQSAPNPSKTIEQNELETAVDQAISELPEPQRMAVVLRRFEEMPYEEIGQIMKMSVPAVKSLLFRARTTLREKLQAHLRDLEGD